MSVDVYAWRELSRAKAFQSRVFDVSQRVMVEESGDSAPKQANFVRIEAPDWANVVAITQDQELVLIEQWRHGVDRSTTEIPGGMIDPGESIEEGAKRELREETGFTAPSWRYLGYVEPNPALQSNKCHTFLATGAQQTHEVDFDGNERCRLLLRPIEEAPSLVASGEITHGLVVVALYLHELAERGLPMRSL